MFLFSEIFCSENGCEIIWSLLSQSVAKVHKATGIIVLV